MTIEEIYNLALEMGIAADPRGRDGVKKWLDRTKKRYEKLSKEDQADFDVERLTNPYADTRIHFGDPKTEVKTIMAGIDMEEPEIMLAAMGQISSQLTDHSLPKDAAVNGEPSTVNGTVDLVIGHHPLGKALAALDEVMNLQADLMAAYGVPINVAEGVMAKRIKEVSRSLNPVNHMRPVDIARRVNMPLMNVHTPADNLVFQFLQDLMKSKKPETVGEIIELLKTVPEYKEAAKNNAGPVIFAGTPESRAGKIVAYDITGGTSGAKELYAELVKAGVGTIIGMHMKDESREEAEKNHLNVVIAGHISSDSIGMNLFLDELSAKGIMIIPASGLIRVRRSK